MTANTSSAGAYDDAPGMALKPAFANSFRKVGENGLQPADLFLPFKVLMQIFG